MQSRKRLLEDAKLYVILDAHVNDYDQLFDIARVSIQLGVPIIQLRDKSGQAKDILDMSKRMARMVGGKAIFIVNDRVDIAVSAGASGVHLGQNDIPIRTAKRMMGARAVIGVSCQSVDQALKAQRDGADYIGFGSVFRTETKPDRKPMDLKVLEKVVRCIRIPVFAIGGIDLENMAAVQSLGITRFAVCRAVCKARNIERAIRDFQNRLSVAKR